MGLTSPGSPGSLNTGLSWLEHAGAGRGGKTSNVCSAPQLGQVSFIVIVFIFGFYYGHHGL